MLRRKNSFKPKVKKHSKKRFYDISFNKNKCVATAKSLNLGCIRKGNLLNQDWSVIWQFNLVLAVFLRDTLLNFAYNTPAFPVSDSGYMNELYNKLNLGEISRSEYNILLDNRFKDWQNKLILLANKFDDYATNKNILTSWTSEYDEKKILKQIDARKQYKCALIEFAEIVDDLEW